MKKVDISISIVSMNNLHDLIVCTNSILKYTQDINSEILINAFRFAENNYNELLAEYSANPMINIQRTDGIKGYSENHNANLLLAKGDVFCILNDDTYINQNIIKESSF